MLLAAGDVLAVLPVDRHQQEQRDVREGQQLEEDAPQARAPLLLERRRGELGHQLAFPLTVMFSHRRIL